MNAIECYNIEIMYFCSDRFFFNGNFQKIRNKHAAFLSNEISSLGAIFDHVVLSMKRLQAQFSCISQSLSPMAWDGMVVGKSFS